LVDFAQLLLIFVVRNIASECLEDRLQKDH